MAPGAGRRDCRFHLPPEEFSIVQQTGAVTSPSFPGYRAEPAQAHMIASEHGAPVVRHDWSAEEAAAIYQTPFMDLLLRAQTTHRRAFDPNKVQFCKLLNVKAGGCPEDCGYCSQSTHHDTGLQASKLMDPAQVIEEAKAAKAAGATRYCMGAAWRSPKARDMAPVIEMVKGVKALGMETCMTLGMLSLEQARQFAEAGLDYYNHNIDTSERFYGEIVSTRTFGDRLETLRHVEASGMKVCCGGILGLGEEPLDRVEMLRTLANLPEHPQSVPVNMLIPIAGTPLAKAEPVDPISFVRTIALARILMPMSDVRLSAGRSAMTDEMQALCFFAGANSIFIGDTLLTAANPSEDRDQLLLRRLGMERLAAPVVPATA
jgi:biotin synthase